MARPLKKIRGVYEYPKNSNAWWILYYDQFGKRHREKVGTRENAISAYQKRKTDIRLGKFLPEDVRMRQANVEEIIGDRIEATKLLRSYRTEKQRLEWWMARFGHKAARSITPSDIEKGRQDLAESRTVATCNRYLAALKATYSLAIRNRKADRNPVKEVRFQKENDKRVRWLTPEEEARLFEVLPKEWHSLVLVALHTGLRRGELLRLKVDRFEFPTALPDGSGVQSRRTKTSTNERRRL